MAVQISRPRIRPHINTPLGFKADTLEELQSMEMHPRDVGSIAQVQESGVFYILENHEGPSWVQIGGVQPTIEERLSALEKAILELDPEALSKIYRELLRQGRG